MSQITISPSAAIGLPLDLTNNIEITGATQNSLLIGSATGSLTNLGAALDGQIVIGSTGNTPVLTTLTAGANITITNGPGVITIAATGVGPTFSDAAFRIYDAGFPNAFLAFDCVEISPGNTRTITMCDQNLSLVDPSFPGNVTAGTSLTVTTGDTTISAGDVIVSAGVLTLPVTNLARTEGAILFNTSVILHGYGTENIFLGDSSGDSITTGKSNTGVGTSSLLDTNSGDENVAVGAYSAQSITLGSANVCIGYQAMDSAITSANNIVIGANAGSNYTSNESSNILIGNQGVLAEDNTIHIGESGSGAGEQNRCFVAGVRNITPAGASKHIVLVDASSQFGSVATLPNAYLTNSAITLSNGNNITVTGSPLSLGGTATIAVSGTTDHTVQVGNAAGALTSLGVGLTAQVLKGNTAADPSWGAVDLTTDVTGYLPVGSGGTGVGSITVHALIVGDTTSPINEIAVGATNEVLLGNTGADPSWGTVGNAALTNSSVTLSDGNNITVTGSPLSLGGTATIALTGTTQYALQVGDATGSLDSLGIGTAGQILQSAGAGAIPAWTTSTYPATTATGDILYGSAANTISELAFDNTATRYLANTGGGATIPAWDQVNLANGVTGTLPVANGGSGFATTTAYAVLCGGTTATNPFQPVASVGTAAQVLTSNGAGALPTFQDAGGGGGGGVTSAFFAINGTTRTNVTGDGTSYGTAIFDTEIFDTGGDFNTTTSRYTAPSDGRVLFTVKYSINGILSAHTRLVFQLFTSNRTASFSCNPYNTGNDAGSLQFSETMLMDMDSGDLAYITGIAVYNGTKVIDLLGDSFSSDPECSFAGFMLP